jgi:hypothetical protein
MLGFNPINTVHPNLKIAARLKVNLKQETNDQQKTITVQTCPKQKNSYVGTARPSSNLRPGSNFPKDRASWRCQRL